MKDEHTTSAIDPMPVEKHRSLREYVGTMVIQMLKIELALVILAILSFVFTGNFSWLALSDRLFWVSMIPIILGAFGILAVISAGANLNPGRAFKPEQVEMLRKNFIKSRQSVDSRYDFCILMWVTGMLGIGISAFVQLVSSAF